MVTDNPKGPIVNTDTEDQANWGLTQSPLRAEKDPGTTPGNRSSARTTASSDGARRIFYRRGHCELVEVVGRRRGRTTLNLNPEILSDPEGTVYLLKALRPWGSNA